MGILGTVYAADLGLAFHSVVLQCINKLFFLSRQWSGDGGDGNQLCLDYIQTTMRDAV